MCPSRWLNVLTGLLFCVTAGLTEASIVHFVNPAPGEEGHYNWHWQGFGNPETLENWLDITRASVAQRVGRNGNSVGQLALGDDDFHNNGSFDAADLANVPGYRITKALAQGDQVELNGFRDSVWHAGDVEGESYFPEGQLRYMGVRTESGNFGWIAVIRRAPGHHEYSFLALEWAYETIPGKGINAGEVPAPGGLSLLAAAMLTGPRRRRKLSG